MKACPADLLAMCASTNDKRSQKSACTSYTGVDKRLVLLFRIEDLHAEVVVVGYQRMVTVDQHHAG